MFNLMFISTSFISCILFLCISPHFMSFKVKRILPVFVYRPISDAYGWQLVQTLKSELTQPWSLRLPRIQHLNNCKSSESPWKYLWNWNLWTFLGGGGVSSWTLSPYFCIHGGTTINSRDLQHSYLNMKLELSIQQTPSGHSSSIRESWSIALHVAGDLVVPVTFVRGFLSRSLWSEPGAPINGGKSKNT